MLSIIKKILEIDWLEYLCKKYKGISKTDRKIFWILFTTLNLMFIFNTINFLFGPDDFGAVIDRCFAYCVVEGRFSANLLKDIFFQKQILPVVNNVFAFMGFVLGTISLFKYWELDKKVKYFVIAGVLLICSPFTNAWLFYSHCIIERFWAVLFIVLGLELAIKYKTKDRAIFYVANAISVLFLLLSISIYQACITTIFIVLFAKLFIKSVEGKFKELFFILKHSLLNISLSAFLYIVVYKVCMFCKIIDTTLPNQQTIRTFSQLLKHTQYALREMYIEIFTYEKALMPEIITKLFLVIILIAIITCVVKIINDKKDSMKKIILSFLVFVLLILFTQIFMIPVDFFGGARVVFYGILFFRIFMLVLIFKYANVYLKNITYIICLILFIEFVTVNFVSQKSFKLAKTSEILRIDRVSNSIEQHPNFIPNKPYNIIIIGTMPSASLNYLGKFNVSDSWDFGNISFIPFYSFACVTRLYVDSIKADTEYSIYTEYSIHRTMHADNKSIKNLLEKHILELKPYPDKNSIVVDGDYIILIYGRETLEKIKLKMFND